MRYLAIFLFVFALFAVLVAAQTETPTETGGGSDDEPTTTREAESPPATTDESATSERESTRTSSTKTDTPTTTSRRTSSGSGRATATAASDKYGPLGPPDVLLRVPHLGVKRIELDVDNLRAEVNLAAQVAKLVEVNAGVQVGIDKVNITIADVAVRLELIIRLGHLVDIVNRTLQSLDLNPLLINLLDTITDVATNVIGAVDGLLGSVIKGNSRLNFYIDNLGNIVQEVVTEAGEILSSIVGNYQQNMTYTGNSENVGDGLTQKTYEYGPLGSLVNIIFNGLDQIVSATVDKKGSEGSSGGGGGGGGGGSSGDEGGSKTTTRESSTRTTTTSRSSSTGGDG